jgi:hypothetical protein
LEAILLEFVMGHYSCWGAPESLPHPLESQVVSNQSDEKKTVVSGEVAGNVFRDNISFSNPSYRSPGSKRQ